VISQRGAAPFWFRDLIVANGYSGRETVISYIDKKAKNSMELGIDQRPEREESVSANNYSPGTRRQFA
jgi:hypothetical protein